MAVAAAGRNRGVDECPRRTLIRFQSDSDRGGDGRFFPWPARIPTAPGDQLAPEPRVTNCASPYGAVINTSKLADNPQQRAPNKSSKQIPPVGYFSQPANVSRPSTATC